jgi:hypothetical protein
MDPVSSEPTESAKIAAYAAVAARRTAWDTLLWQVPVLSLTAQAFLFTIALGGADAWGRMIAAFLSLDISVISIMLMGRHRQAELHDAHWLEAFEEQHLHLGALGAHGTAFRANRDMEGLDAGRIGDLVPLRPMFGYWVMGLALFGLAAIAVVVRTAVQLAT